MGFYNLATQAPVYRSATSGAVPSAPWMQQPSVSQYELFQQYYSPFSEGEYDKKAFSRATTEAINHGLNIPKDVKKSMEELAKNGDKWFDNEGNLLEGLSEKEAKKATEHRKRVYYYYDKLKRKYVSPERKRAQWASKNFIKNGFDTTAASQYAALTNYSDLANLWGGDVSGALKGGLYGAKASANEKAFYDKLTAPQKRAYLNQREQWVKSGLLKAAGGLDLSNGLLAVTDQDMLKYILDNIQNWQNSFYGNNGYDDEYELSHPVYDQNTAYLYQLYGIPQAQASQAWVPTNTIRTSGFIIPLVSQSIKVSSTSRTGSTKHAAKSNTRRTANSGTSKKDNTLLVLDDKSIQEIKELLNETGLSLTPTQTYRVNGKPIQVVYDSKNGITFVARKDSSTGHYILRGKDKDGNIKNIDLNILKVMPTETIGLKEYLSQRDQKEKPSKGLEKKKKLLDTSTSYTEGSAKNDTRLKNMRKTTSKYEKTLDQINKREERLKYLDNVDKTSSSVFKLIDDYLKKDSSNVGYSYTGEIVKLPGGYGDLSGRLVYHFDPEGFGEYYIYPDGTIIESKLIGSAPIDHDPLNNSGKENYTTMRLLAESIFKNGTKTYNGDPIKWRKYRATSRKQGGTLDYKHYFDFFNNTFN